MRLLELIPRFNVIIKLGYQFPPTQTKFLKTPLADTAALQSVVKLLK